MLTIDYQNNTLLLPGTQEKTAFPVDLGALGWDFAKHIRLQAQIPCFTGGGAPLLADALALSDEGLALAILLVGIPLDNEDELRVIADVYSNSAKRLYGQRPAVFFLTGGKCKAVHSLLGKIEHDPKPMARPVFEEWIASHNIQEETLFGRMLEDPPLAREFLTNELDVERINAMLLGVLRSAEKEGFVRYYNTTVCPTDEQKKQLRKQALLLAGLGEERYIALSKKQVETVRHLLTQKAHRIFSASLAVGDPWDLNNLNTTGNRMLDWAFRFGGWNPDTDIIKNASFPCYFDPSMELLCDFAFLDPNGKPVVLLLKDTLNLSQNKQFITAEFYARSAQAVHGVTPFVVFYTKSGALMKMGALSGGCQPISRVLPAMEVMVQAACVNITERRAWNALLKHVTELQELPDGEKRFARQLELVRKSADDTNHFLKDPNFTRREFLRIGEDTDVVEERFWKELLGQMQYEESRAEELKLIRTFVADKRIALGDL